MADIGARGGTFNDATRPFAGGTSQPCVAQGGRATGSVNADNHHVLLNEANVMFKDLEHMVNQTGGQFDGLTYVHARALLYQVDLERDYINGVANEPGGRGSNDNILDMIDIVQNDDNLAALAQDGFAPFSEPLHDTTKYTDDAPQTLLWANFIPMSNPLGEQRLAA